MSQVKTFRFGDAEFTMDVGPATPSVVEDWASIAFACSLYAGKKLVWQGEYKLGIGHVDPRKTVPSLMNLTIEERGFLEAWQSKPYANFTNKQLQAEVAAKVAKYTKVRPEIKDVLWSILLDASPAIDREGFEDWCGNLGYDSDSIKAKKIYDQCLDIGFKLVSALGMDLIEQLREYFQDY